MENQGVQETIDGQVVEIYGRFISKEDEDFDTMFGDKIPNEDHIQDPILPTFELKSRVRIDQSAELRDMITSEINERMMNEDSIRDITVEMGDDDIKTKYPYGEPRTERVLIGEVFIPEDRSSIISFFDFDDLIDQMK